MALNSKDLERYQGQSWESGRFRFRPPSQREFNFFAADGYQFAALQSLTLDAVVAADEDRFISGTLRHVYSAPGPHLTERPAPPIVVGVNPDLWLGSDFSYQPEGQESLLRRIEEANITGRTDRMLGRNGHRVTLVDRERFPNAFFVMGTASMYGQAAVALAREGIVMFDDQFTATIDEIQRGYNAMIGANMWTEPQNERTPSPREFGKRPLRKLTVMGYDFIQPNLYLGDYRPQKQLLPLVVFVEQVSGQLPENSVQTALVQLPARTS